MKQSESNLNDYNYTWCQKTKKKLKKGKQNYEGQKQGPIWLNMKTS